MWAEPGRAQETGLESGVLARPVLGAIEHGGQHNQVRQGLGGTSWGSPQCLCGCEPEHSAPLTQHPPPPPPLSWRAVFLLSALTVQSVTLPTHQSQDSQLWSVISRLQGRVRYSGQEGREAPLCLLWDLPARWTQPGTACSPPGRGGGASMLTAAGVRASNRGPGPACSHLDLHLRLDGESLPIPWSVSLFCSAWIFPLATERAPARAFPRQIPQPLPRVLLPCFPLLFSFNYFNFFFNMYKPYFHKKRNKQITKVFVFEKTNPKPAS